MFHPDKDFRFIVLETLTDEGKSISSLAKDLNGKGVKINRLLLTGYLRALTDLKIVKEKTVPPAKIYIPMKGKERDFFIIVGDKSRQLFESKLADEVTLFALNRIMKRAIFAEELARAGVEGNAPGRPATPEERADARKVLIKSGFKVPDSSKAFLHEGPGLEKEFTILVESLIVENYDIGYLVKETKQTKLTL
ncbi:MAG: hypothetical protein A4E32_01574 [Methanomassiliicoccales archaeon PtaU1.Bin124]|nr:MAG: hypothetical protein A4E32_01574 [Methanomassiliicoccales archaeon PtaU1.Bin124]